MKIAHELRLIEVDNQEAANIGALEKNSEAINVVEPMWETVDEGPPLVDEDWHASCQAVHKRVKGAEWKNFL